MLACQKAKAWLEERSISYDLRDIKQNNPTVEELTAWYQKSGLPLKKLFNTSCKQGLGSRRSCSP